VHGLRNGQLFDDQQCRQLHGVDTLRGGHVREHHWVHHAKPSVHGVRQRQLFERHERDGLYALDNVRSRHLPKRFRLRQSQRHLHGVRSRHVQWSRGGHDLHHVRGGLL
jgi:hypothetical protein